MSGNNVSPAELSRAVAAAVQAHRVVQAQRFGFAHVRVAASVDEASRTVRLEGEVLARRFAARMATVVQAVVPAGWTVDAAGLKPRTTAPWHAVVLDPTALLAAIPGDDRRAELATELRPHDGPVQRLAEQAGFALVRATDGTLGWTDAPLGDIVQPPRFATPGRIAPDAFVSAVRAYLDAPYRLGGTTAAGIDCSGLVQRALRDAGAGLVPRHSSDQLTIDPRPGPGDDAPGDLVFVWTSTEAPCHVGIADGAGVVLHASRHRGVVGNARADVLATASRASHVPWASVIALQAKVEGAAAIDDVLELGRPAP